MSTHPTIRPFRPEPANYSTLARLAGAAFPHLACDFEFPSPTDWQRFDDGLHSIGRSMRRFTAELEGRTVGYAQVFQVPWADNPDRAWGNIRVAPEYRRRGIGSRLLDAAVSAAREIGVRALQVQFRAETPEVAGLLARRGFTEELRGLRMSLDPRVHDLHVLKHYLEHAAEKGITLSSVAAEQQRGADWLPRLYSIYMRLMREVPVPEKPLIAPDEFEEFVIGQPQSLPEACFIARDGERYLGVCMLQRHPDDPQRLSQDLTGVLPEGRGRGIAMALKVQSINFAQAGGFTEISTWVESTNEPMLAINRKLGFDEQPGLILYRLAL
jgi:GNAT superfamily N-acetyltransferase